MIQQYNPIVRTFCQVRAVLLAKLPVTREQIRPATPLATLVPPEHQDDICRELGSEVGRQSSVIIFPLLSILVGVAMSLVAAALAFVLWQPAYLLVPLPLYLILLCCWPRHLLPVQFSPALKTVGDLVLFLTRFSEHKQSGYRWTRNEISCKVRLIFARNLGLPLEKVRPDSALTNLWGEYD